MENSILSPEGTTSRKNLLDLNAIFNNRDQHDPPNKPPTPTNFTRVKVQSKYPSRVPRVKPHSKDTTRVPRVKQPAAKSSPKQTL